MASGLRDKIDTMVSARFSAITSRDGLCRHHAFGWFMLEMKTYDSMIAWCQHVVNSMSCLGGQGGTHLIEITTSTSID